MAQVILRPSFVGSQQLKGWSAYVAKHMDKEDQCSIGRHNWRQRSSSCFGLDHPTVKNFRLREVCKDWNVSTILSQVGIIIPATGLCRIAPPTLKIGLNDADVITSFLVRSGIPSYAFLQQPIAPCTRRIQKRSVVPVKRH